MTTTGGGDTITAASTGALQSGSSPGTTNGGSPTKETAANTQLTSATNKTTNGGILKPSSNKATHEALSKQVDKNFEGATPEVGGVVALRSENHVLLRVTFELFQQLIISYIVRTFKHAKDVKEGLRTLTCPKAAFVKTEKPEEPTGTLGEVDKMILAERVKDFVKRYNNLDETLDKSFHVIWGQCTPGMQGALSAYKEFEAAERDCDAIRLLTKIKERMAGMHDAMNPFLQFMDIWRQFLNLRQGEGESDTNFFARFKASYQLLELIGGKGGFNFDCLGTKVDTNPIETLPVKNDGKWTLTDSTKTAIAEFDVIKGETYEVHMAKTDSELEEEKANEFDTSEKFKSMCLVRSISDKHYGHLKQGLRESMYLGRDEYPTRVQSTMELVLNASGSLDYQRMKSNGPSNGKWKGGKVSFVQTHGQDGPDDENKTCELVKGVDNKVYNGVFCYHCKKPGHYRGQCPSATDAQRKGWKKGSTNTQLSVALASSQMEKLPQDWILLDSCSTDGTTNDPNVLYSYTPVTDDEVLELDTNGGQCFFKHRGWFTHFPYELYFNPDSLGTILSMHQVFNLPGVSVVLEHESEPTFVLTYGTLTMKFKSYDVGLFYCDVSDSSSFYYGTPETLASMNDVIVSDKTKQEITQYPSSHVQTVASNKALYSAQEIEGADKALELQQYIGWPGTSTYIGYVKNNLIKNCPVSVADIQRALKIYGTPTPTLQGKMTQRKFAPADETYIPLLDLIAAEYTNTILDMDNFYVNGRPFFHTKSRKINFLSIMPLERRTMTEIIKGLTTIKDKYENRGFTITEYHGDNEFDTKAMEDFVGDKVLNICAAREHNPFIERSIRTTKERARSIYHGLPYVQIPILMLNSLVRVAIHWRNQFPSKTGVSQTVSPATIVEGKDKPDLGKKEDFLWSVCAGTYRHDQYNKSKECTCHSIVSW